MPKYKYRAVDENGRKCKDSIEKGSVEEVVAFIGKLGMAPLSVKPVGDLRSKRFQKTLLRDMCQGLQTLLDTEPSPLQAFEALASWRKGQNRVLQAVSQALSKGASLSDAFFSNRRFPRIIGVACQLGEEKGKLPQAFSALANFYEKEVSLSFMAYGAFLMCFIPLAAASLLVPVFLGVGGGSGAFSLATFLPSLALLALALAAIALSRINSPLLHFIKRKAPLLGRIQRCLMSIKLCLLLHEKEAGWEVFEVLSVFSGSLEDKLLADAVLKVGEAVSQGRSAWPLLDSSCFDMVALKRLKGGEEKGALPDAARKCAASIEKQLEALLGKSVAACCAIAGFTVFIAVVYALIEGII
jgi:type II secretory pathway component PulF